MKVFCHLKKTNCRAHTKKTPPNFHDGLFQSDVPNLRTFGRINSYQYPKTSPKETLCSSIVLLLKIGFRSYLMYKAKESYPT